MHSKQDQSARFACDNAAGDLLKAAAVAAVHGGLRDLKVVLSGKKMNSQNLFRCKSLIQRIAKTMPLVRSLLALRQPPVLSLSHTHTHTTPIKAMAQPTPAPQKQESKQ